jgi:hypothetical protein
MSFHGRAGARYAGRRMSMSGDQASRRPWLPVGLGVLAVAGLATSLWLYRDNRRLAEELRAAQRPDPWAAPASTAGAATPAPGRFPGLPGVAQPTPTPAPPSLPAAPGESRMERRSRRSLELAALLGRSDGESEDEYRARVLPLLTGALERPRQNVEEMRRQAEEKAGVTAEQRAALDTAFADVYGELVSYTNGAIADGQLTPYQRNVTGMLDYAGGLGAILSGAEQKVGKVLSAEQQRTMYEAGFEWGEYLGVKAPWELLRPPPPPPPTGDGS